MGFFSNLKSKFSNVSVGARFRMVEDRGNGFYAWNGKLYQSDIVRACIRPKTKAIGKAVSKHIRETVNNTTRTIQTNPDAYMKFLLEEPNPHMSGQMLQEKVANQLALNNNAFVLIIKDDFGWPMELYPIPASQVEAVYYNNELFLKFYYKNGNNNTFPYSDIIHIRDDFNDNDIFGESPAQSLSDLMNCISIVDQGLINAIKNSGAIRWLLKFNQALRPEDLKKNVKEFTDTYLSMSSESMGAAGVDVKADATQIQPNDYVPNAILTDNLRKRVYAFFNTNENIVNSTYDENEWISYYESCVEPIVLQMSNEYTRKLFSRRERSFGNKIVFESSNLTFASMSTKLQLVQYVDRGIMTPNEVRAYLNLAPIDGGDVALLRKDTGTLQSSSENKAKFKNVTELSNASDGTKVYAVDFDGTLCNSMYPKIGSPKQDVIDYVKDLKSNGHKVILWTCRCGEYLDDAIEWCKDKGIEFDGVNENLQDHIDKYGNDCRKIYADYYLDDKAMLVSDVEGGDK